MMEGGNGFRLNLCAIAETNKRKNFLEDGARVQKKIFGDSEEEQDEGTQYDGVGLMKLNADSMAKRVRLQDKNSAKRLIDKALEDDPYLFDYDGAYEKTKFAENAKNILSNEVNEDGSLKPKYYNSIIGATARRKLELKRIEIKKARRERELEKDEFGEKEEFITLAYRRKIEEIEQLEVQEKLLEESRSKNRETDLIEFYKDILDKGVKNKNVDVNSEGANYTLEIINKMKDEKPQINKIENSNVEVNDSNEVVDKTQLFKGGLNLSDNSKLRDMRVKIVKNLVKNSPQMNSSPLRSNSSMENLRRSVLKQRHEALEKAKPLKEQKLKKLKEALASKITDSDVANAMQRYANRKKLDSEESDE